MRVYICISHFGVEAYSWVFSLSCYSSPNIYFYRSCWCEIKSDMDHIRGKESDSARLCWQHTQSPTLSSFNWSYVALSNFNCCDGSEYPISSAFHHICILFKSYDINSLHPEMEWLFFWEACAGMCSTGVSKMQETKKIESLTILYIRNENRSNTPRR